jgi:site-specific recombinase XerD
VKGAKRLGIRLGNWLTSTQGRELLGVPDRASVKGKRNYAMLAVLLGCGLRRSELTRLTVSHLQQQDGHWAIVDLFGKGGHVRTVPVPAFLVQQLVIHFTENVPALFSKRAATKNTAAPHS